MKVFVTGASGFVGQHFLQELLQSAGESTTICALVRGENSGVLSDHRMRVLKGDLADLNKHKDIICDCDYVFHIAANASYAKGANYFETNTQPTKDLIEILKASHRLKLFVYVSTIGAVDRTSTDFCSGPLHNRSSPAPRSDYGRSKLEAEQIVRSSGLPFTIIRPTWVWGKNMRVNSHVQKFITLAAEEKSGVFRLDFPGKVSLIHVRDLARSLRNCIDNKNVIGKTYFAVTQSISLGKLLSLVWESVHLSQPTQFQFVRYFTWIRFFHAFLPLSVSNLFADYLYAQDETFIADLCGQETSKIEENIAEVVKDNVAVNGLVVITGAGSGIGLEVAKKLYERGEKLLLIDRDTRCLEPFKKATVIEIDLAKNHEIEKLRDCVGDQRVKALINNAGVGFKGSVGGLSQGQIEAMIGVNVLAPVTLVRVLAKILRRDGSTILNVGSSVAYSPLPGMSVYAASKAFVVNWSEALAIEWKNTNRVVTFSPSGTATAFQKGAGVSTASGKLMDPSHVADMIVTAISHGKKHIVVGVASKVLILVCRFLPMRTSSKIWGGLFAQLR